MPASGMHIVQHIHTYIHACIHAYIHTCIHAYMHTYMHAYIHTYVAGKDHWLEQLDLIALPLLS